MAMKRPYGAEQPYIPLGMFHVRIPFIHAVPTFPEALQGMCNAVLCFGSMATITLCTGVSDEAAYGAAFVSTFLYILNQLAGDPTVCGWIMPAVPLVTMFCQSFPEGERIKAMCALQLVLGLIFILLGATGLVKKICTIVPPAIKGGIILGAAISSIYGEFKEGGRMGKYPISLSLSQLLMVFLLYSPIFKSWCEKGNKVALFFAKLGLIPAVLLALAVAPAVGEAQWGFSLTPLITIPNFSQMFAEMSPFAVGFPSAKMFLSAIPTAFAIYIVAFGDTVVLQGIVEDGGSTRDDEYFSVNVSRVNITAGLRNIIMALLCPFAPLASPLGAAFTISMFQGYKLRGMDNYYTIHSGTMSENWVPWITMLVTPVVSLVRPVAAICMSLCLVSQGFTCTAKGVEECRGNATDLAIAGAIASVIVAKGAAWGFGIGIICYIFLSSTKKMKEDIEYNKSIVALEEEKERKANELLQQRLASADK